MAIEQNGNYSPSERIVSPGVFTREVDQTFLAQGVAAIGGVVVAPFSKGPGFSPTVVTSEGDLENIFGAADGTLYGPITAQQYLRQQGQVTVVRVGGLAGYNQQQALLVTAVPGQYARYQENAIVSGSLLDATINPNSSVNGIFKITGSVQVTFGSGYYEGETIEIGTVQFATQNANTVTSSLGEILSFTTSSITVSGVSPWNGTKIETLTLTRVNGACDFTLEVSGMLTGSYGAFNPNAFTLVLD